MQGEILTFRQNIVLRENSGQKTQHQEQKPHGYCCPEMRQMAAVFIATSSPCAREARTSWVSKNHSCFSVVSAWKTPKRTKNGFNRENGWYKHRGDKKTHYSNTFAFRALIPHGGKSSFAINNKHRGFSTCLHVRAVKIDGSCWKRKHCLPTWWLECLVNVCKINQLENMRCASWFSILKLQFCVVRFISSLFLFCFFFFQDTIAVDVRARLDDVTDVREVPKIR